MRSMLFRVLALVRKELLTVLKDPQGRASLIVPPILECLLFGYAATYDLHDVPYAVVDRDHSAASRRFLAGFDGSGVFHQVSPAGSSGASGLIDRGDALLVVEIEAGFERHLRSGVPARVQIISDGRNSNTAATATGYVERVIDTFNAKWRAQEGGGPQLRVTERSWYNPNLETRWHMLTGLLGMTGGFQMVLFASMSVAREREQGTLDQLLVTPFRTGEILFGKALAALLVGLVQVTNTFLVAKLWFGIPLVGSVLVLYSGLAVFLVTAIGVGLLVAARSRSMQQALLFTFAVMLPSILLSGLMTPIQAMPEVLQYATQLNPVRYSIDLVQRVFLEGAGPSSLVSDLSHLVLQAALVWVLAYRAFVRHLT